MKKGPFIAAGLFMAGSALGQTVSALATFHNVGIDVRFTSPPAAGTIVSTAVKRAAAPDDYRLAHPLSRIASNLFAGSIFRLESGTAYSIRLQAGAYSSNISVTTRSENVPSATNRTIHVAPNGHDTNSGFSAETPFRTLGHALDIAAAGDRIWLHDGRYYEGNIEIYKSGTASQPIAVESTPGERAILDGTDTNFTTVWTIYDAPNGLYRTPLTAQPANAYLNGQQFYRYLDLEDLRTNRWGQGTGYHVDGSWLYARFPAAGTPGTNIVTVPAFTTCITLLGSYFQFRNLEFCFFGRDDYHRGIYLDGADYNLIEHCQFHHNGVGVAIKRAAHFNTIQFCVFDESPIDSFAWSAVKNGGGDYEAGGIYLYGSSSSNQGNVIRYNTFQNMFDGSHIYSDDSSGPTLNMDVHDNLYLICGDDGIETDGAGSNVRIYNNIFRNFLTGLSVAPASIGPLYVFRNVFSGWHGVEVYEGYPFKFNHGYAQSTDWIHLYHNTCYTDVPGQDGFLFKNYSRWTNIISRNNIYAGTDYALENWSTNNPVNFDYDALFTTNTLHFIYWAGTDYATLPAFYAATGQETNGMTAEPRFRASETNDYRLCPDSPLIDRGIIIPGMNDDYVGPAPDIGAFEFQHDAHGIIHEPTGILTTWMVVSGLTYRLQSSTNLVDPGWIDIGIAFATSVYLQLPDTNSAATCVFYRAQIE